MRNKSLILRLLLVIVFAVPLFSVSAQDEDKIEPSGSIETLYLIENPFFVEVEKPEVAGLKDSGYTCDSESGCIEEATEDEYGLMTTQRQGVVPITKYSDPATGIVYTGYYHEEEISNHGWGCYPDPYLKRGIIYETNIDLYDQESLVEYYGLMPEYRGLKLTTGYKIVFGHTVYGPEKQFCAESSDRFYAIEDWLDVNYRGINDRGYMEYELTSDGEEVSVAMQWFFSIEKQDPIAEINYHREDGEIYVDSVKLYDDTLLKKGEYMIVTPSLRSVFLDYALVEGDNGIDSFYLFHDTMDAIFLLMLETAGPYCQQDEIVFHQLFGKGIAEMKDSFVIGEIQPCS